MAALDLLHTLLDDLQRLHQHLTGLLASLAEPGHDLNTYVPDMEAVADRLMGTFGASPDVMVRRFRIDGVGDGVLCYLDNLVDVDVIDRDILGPLLRGLVRTPDQLPVGQVRPSRDWPTLMTAVAHGQAIVCLHAQPEAWIINTAQMPHRSIDRPETEVAVRGPQEAFADVLAVQLSQVRHRLPSPHLTFDQVTLGSRYPVAVAIAYLGDVVNPALRQAVYDRLCIWPTRNGQFGHAFSPVWPLRIPQNGH